MTNTSCTPSTHIHNRALLASPNEQNLDIGRKSSSNLPGKTSTDNASKLQRERNLSWDDQYSITDLSRAMSRVWPEPSV
jgi:hypothetical protein